MAVVGSLEPSPVEKRLVYTGLAAYFACSLIVALCSSGTYDAGDSIMHFQFAHYAFSHPINLLSHWAKPFFTLVAAPFAAVGFGGMKLFQCLLALGIGYMTYRNAIKLQLCWAWIAPILVLAAPEFFLAQLSGLTEPLFAFMLTLGIFWILHDRPLLGALALSLLPFVRTEGFLVLPAFGFYFLLRRQWKAIPVLATGTVVYAILGGIFLGDFLWIWTKNPYAAQTLNYGIGGLLHFPEKYVFIVGIPIYVLTILGLVVAIPRLLLQKTKFPMEELLLVLAPWAIYLGAHIYFWATGTGHSMGLIRVLIGILPMAALFATAGFGQKLEWIPARFARLRLAILATVMLYVVAFPFIPNPASIRLDELQLTVDQEMLKSVAVYIQENRLDTRKMYSAHPSASYFCGIDPFDPARFRSLNRYRDDQPLESGNLVLLDSWFGKVESGYTPAFFDQQPQAFRLLQAWHGAEGNTPIGIYLYEKI